MKKYIRQIKEKVVQSFHCLSGCTISNNIHVASCLDYPDALLLDFYGHFIAYTWTTCRNVIGHNLIRCLMDEWGTTKACLLRCLSLSMWPAFIKTFEMGISWHTINYGRSENIFTASCKTKQKGSGRV
jgi:hypothetical protein